MAPKKPNQHDLQGEGDINLNPVIKNKPGKVEEITLSIRKALKKYLPLIAAAGLSIAAHYPLLPGKAPKTPEQQMFEIQIEQLDAPDEYKEKLLADKANVDKRNIERLGNKEKLVEELGKAKEKLLYQLNHHPESVDHKEVIFDIKERLDQGVEPEVIEEAKINAAKIFSDLKNELPLKPDIEALKKIVTRLSPPRTADNTRSVLADSLACGICDQSQNCDARYKMMVLALSEIYPQFKKDIYVQAYGEHKDTLFKLNGKFYIMRDHVPTTTEDEKSVNVKNAIMSVYDDLKMYAGENPKKMVKDMIINRPDNNTKEDPIVTDSMTTQPDLGFLNLGSFGSIESNMETSTADRPDKTQNSPEIETRLHEIKRGLRPSKTTKLVILDRDTWNKDQLTENILDVDPLVIFLQPESFLSPEGSKNRKYFGIQSPTPEFIDQLMEFKNHPPTNPSEPIENLELGDVTYYDEATLTKLINASNVLDRLSFTGAPPVLLAALDKISNPYPPRIGFDFTQQEISADQIQKIAGISKKFQAGMEIVLGDKDLHNLKIIAMPQNIRHLKKTQELRVKVYDDQPTDKIDIDELITLLKQFSGGMSLNCTGDSSNALDCSLSNELLTIPDQLLIQALNKDPLLVLKSVTFSTLDQSNDLFRYKWNQQPLAYHNCTGLNELLHEYQRMQNPHENELKIIYYLQYFKYWTTANINHQFSPKNRQKVLATINELLTLFPKKEEDQEYWEFIENLAQKEAKEHLQEPLPAILGENPTKPCP